MTIIQIGNPTLRKHAAEIAADEIIKRKTKDLIKKMKEALRAEPAGIGLAAPQIDVSKSIFIVSKYVLEKKDLISKNEEELKKKKEKEEYAVFINPKIIKYSAKKSLCTEGCLSVAGKFGKVRRSTNVTVEALDENGQLFKRGAGGLLAQVLQHEVDHLNGILFVDKVEKMDK
ncbi:MAG: peptide deformylase [Candidatus Niyogibacteria bacterium]|nr:peptide deformylase [Candidatus Niyogibacteria bacterium]